MSQFSVTLYAGNYASRYKLDDLIRRSFNGKLDRDVSCLGQRLYLPIVKEDEEYRFVSDSPSWEFSMNGGQLLRAGAADFVIHHGDYLEAQRGDIAYSALFLDENRMSLTSAYYETDFTSPVMIGRGEQANIRIQTSLSVSRDHAAICRGRDGVYVVEKNTSQTGVYVNGQRSSERRLQRGDAISIGGVTIIFMGDGLIVPVGITVSGLKLREKHEELPTDVEHHEEEYVRVLRRHQSLSSGSITIDPPSVPNKETKMPFLLTAGPSMTMSLVMLVSFAAAINAGNPRMLITSGAMAFSMLCGALLWPTLIRRYHEKQRREAEQHRVQRYQTYIAELDREIGAHYAENTRVWRTMFPSPQQLLEMTDARDTRIWERTPKDDDFLTLRIGSGERPFEYQITTPQQGFVLDQDKLAEEAKRLIERYSLLKDVPQTLSLMEKKTLGVIGMTNDVAKGLLMNLAFFHASDDVKLVLVYNRFQADRYGSFSSLPHCWSDDRSRRYVATTKAEAQTLFGLLDETIQMREELLQKTERRIPHFVCMIFDMSLLEDIPFRRYLLDSDNQVGVSAVFFGERLQDVPKECARIIDKGQDYCGVYYVNEHQNRFMHYANDEVSDDEFNAFIGSLSQLKTQGRRGTARIPDSVNFLETYQVGNLAALGIMNRWRTNASHKSLAAIIGVRQGNQAFLLDIHQKHHGCHGLVAGTTGSGKSEFLQAYILSMMINYSPNEVSFVLVDFKGGDMIRPFLDTPHLAASISNLSENMLYRALVSLEAEVKTREHAFNRAAHELQVDKLDINSYHRYFKEGRLKEPLPHLVIIIDEFAQLKMQHSEFMDELIRIAQVGRSLGIHLILATQKPTGVVDPQIWSNSRFKVCLKVADKQDSNEMIGRPDAALIKNPGRAYVQIGYDEIFEEIQSGYSGAEYIAKDRFIDEESAMVSMINAPCEKVRSARDVPDRKGREELSQITAVATEIRALGKRMNLSTRPLWQPLLPEKLSYESCAEGYASFDPARCDQLPPGQAVLGMVDLPEVQKQIMFRYDFLKQGNLAVYGSAGFGTTTFVQSLVYSMALRYSPEWLRLIVMDFDGGSLINLSKMPHCQAYANGSEEDQVVLALNRIEAMVQKRRELFAEYSCATYEAYIKASGKSLPVVLMIMDNYSGFRERASRLEDKVLRLVSTAKTCGIFAIITGNSKGAIYFRLTDHLANQVIFTMNDTGSYRELLGVRPPVQPGGIKGRALMLYEKTPVEVQISVPFSCDDEAERNRQIAATYAEMKRIYGDVRDKDEPLPLPTMEAKPKQTAEPLITTLGLEPLKPVEQMTSPLLVGHDIQTDRFVGFETEGTQRILISGVQHEEMFDVIAKQACRTGQSVFVITSRDRRLPEGAVLVQDLDQFVTERFAPEAETKGIYIIDDFLDMYQRISDEALKKTLLPYLRSGRPGCFVTMGDLPSLKKISMTGLYTFLGKAPNGMILGGGVDNKMANMLNGDLVHRIPTQARSRALKPTQAFCYSEGAGAYVDLPL